MKRLLSPWHTVIFLAAAGVLAACEPTPPTATAPSPLPSAAPADGAGPSGVPEPTTGAVQGLNADAALVAQSATQVDALPSHAQPSSNASPLGALKPYVGTYPSDSNVSFLEQGVLAQRLKQLLGKDYGTLLANLRTVSPLTEDAGRWFITGNRPHEGGTEAAAVVIDPQRNALRVWMLHEGTVTQYQDPVHVDVPWPADVQTMLNNHQAAAKP
jgi:hypothetical protein